MEQGGARCRFVSIVDANLSERAYLGMSIGGISDNCLAEPTGRIAAETRDFSRSIAGSGWSVDNSERGLQSLPKCSLGGSQNKDKSRFRPM